MLGEGRYNESKEGVVKKGTLTIVDSDKLYLWAEDAEDGVEVKLTPYIERKLKKYGYWWKAQPEIE